MGILFAYIANSRYVVEIHVIVFGEVDQHVERDAAAACFVIGISSGRDLQYEGDSLLGKIMLLSEFLNSGLTCDAHRYDPFDKLSI